MLPGAPLVISLSSAMAVVSVKILEEKHEVSGGGNAESVVVIATGVAS